MKICFLFLALLITCHSKAQDYVSGVSTEAISVPSIAGSVEGVKIESVDTQNLGNFSFGLKIDVPAGVNGLSPDLKLTYNSLLGQSPFGQGWELNLPTISIDSRKGVPRYDGNLTFQSPEGELVKILREGSESHFYSPLINNSQSLFEYKYDERSWVWHKSSGQKVYYFGTPNSTIRQNENVFKWFPTKIVDSIGNEILFTYSNSDGVPLIIKIDYAIKDESPHYKVEFTYSERDDAVISYKGSFKASFKHVCSRILVKSYPNHIIRSYELSYSEAPYTKIKFLSTFKQKGENGSDPSSPMPPISFTYAGVDLDVNIESTKISFEDSEVFPPSLSKSRASVVDINRDSFPDILETSRTGANVWINNGLNAFDHHYTQNSFISLLGAGQSKLLDVDGDRIVDFVTTGLSPVFYKGGIETEDQKIFFSTQSTPIQNIPKYSIGSSNVRTLDINGDGRLDIIAREVNSLKTYISTETGKWGLATDFPANTSSYDFSSPYSFVADMNADGLVDLVFVRSNGIIYLANMGNGAFDVPKTLSFDDGGELIIELFMKSKFNFVVDINNDGYSDLVSVYKDGLFLSLNKGNNHFSSILEKHSIHDGPFSEIGLHVSTLDFNGNGTTDILWTNDDHDWRYIDFSSGILNLLTKIENGLGQKTELEYEFASRYTQDGASLKPVLPHPVITLKSKKDYLLNSISGEENHSYSGGFYDGSKNDFLGFNVITKTIEGDDSIASLFSKLVYEQGRLQSNYRQKSMLLKKEDFEGNILMRAEEYTISTVDTFESSEDVKPGISFASQTISIEGDAELNSRSSKSLRFLEISSDGFIHKDTAHRYLDLVNLVRIEERVLASSIDEDRNLANRLCEFNIYDSSSSKISSDRFFYDGQELCEVREGLLTRKESWNGNDYEHKSTFTYKGFGSLASFSDSLSRFTEVEYDSLDIYPLSVTNPAGHLKVAAYNSENGTVTSITDENNRLTSFYYDSYLRVNKVVGPADSLVLPTTEAIYTFGDENGILSSIVIKKREKSGAVGTFDSKEFFDGLGRSSFKISEGPAARFVLEGKAYNKRNLEHKSFQRSFVSSFSQPANMNGIRYFETQYDSLQRPILIFNPEHSLESPSYKENYYLVGEMISYDEERKVSYAFKDALGRRTRFLDALENEVEYEFDSRDLLTKITDPQGSETIFGYDSQKRRVCKVDPTVGLTEYFYNTENLVIQKKMYGFVDGHNSCTPPNAVTPRIVSMEYNDSLNRMTKMDYPSGSNTEDISYFYDDSLSMYSKGKLSSVDFGIGSKKFDFDIYGNQSKITLILGSSEYITEKIFNGLGKVEKIIYPTVGSNSFAVEYGFDEGSNLKSIKDSSNSFLFYQDAKYSPLGQLEEVYFGNSTKTTMTYDNEMQSYRLNKILVEKLGVPNTVLQEIEYSYNKVSNITQRNDQKNVFNESYTYDDLHRLISADLGGASKSWMFDEIGNITNNDGNDYLYNSNRKQIISSVDGNSYSFDPFGNISSDIERIFVFDWNNRLRSMTKSSATSQYNYGEDGMRISKTTPIETTIFIDKFTELRGTDVIRHIFADNKLIASQDESNQFFYSHSDVLKSSNLKTDSAGNVVKRIEYQPFGSKRLEAGSFNKIKQRFTSQFEDEESDLYYFKHRYYDPSLGRMISADPLYLEQINELGIDPQSLNLYSYASNNPTSCVDPSGLWSLRVGLATSGGFLVNLKGELGGAISYSKEFGLQVAGYGAKTMSFGSKVGVDIGAVGAFSFDTKSVKDLDGTSMGGSGGGGVLGRLSVGSSTSVSDDGRRMTETSGSFSIGPVAEFGGEAEMSNLTTTEPITLFGGSITNSSGPEGNIYNGHPEYSPQHIPENSINDSSANTLNFLNDFNSFFTNENLNFSSGE